MFVPFIVAFAVLPAVFCQFNGILGQFGRRPGACPPTPDVDICEMSCYGDYNCAGVQKCCRTACGGTFCINPVTAVNSLRAKSGVCPEPSGPWVCSSRCQQDSDCRGKKKCCRNRCGANACINPAEDEYDNENEIPLIA